MYARVSRYQVPVASLGDDIRGADETEKRVADWPGSAGLYYLVDRESGQTMAITLWDDEQSMSNSENNATQLRQETSSKSGAKLVSVERYEVVAQPAKVPAGSR